MTRNVGIGISELQRKQILNALGKGTCGANDDDIHDKKKTYTISANRCTATI